jgi:hypothetical protein
MPISEKRKKFMAMVFPLGKCADSLDLLLDNVAATLCSFLVHDGNNDGDAKLEDGRSMDVYHGCHRAYE